MLKAKLYIANLGAYARGELVGAWVNLPTSEERLQKIIDKILAGGELPKDNPDEEIAIHDYESNFNLEVSEYDKPLKINKLLNKVRDADERIFAAVFRACDDDLERAVECYHDGDYTVLCDINNEKDLGHAIVDEGIFKFEIPEELVNYIDYEAIGRDYVLNGPFHIYGDLNLAIELYE